MVERQAHDTLARTWDAARVEHGRNARAARDLTILQEALLAVSAQTGIFSAMLTRLSAVPGIRATLGDLQRLAAHRDRVVVAVRPFRWTVDKIEDGLTLFCQVGRTA